MYLCLNDLINQENTHAFRNEGTEPWEHLVESWVCGYTLKRLLVEHTQTYRSEIKKLRQ